MQNNVTFYHKAAGNTYESYVDVPLIKILTAIRDGNWKDQAERTRSLTDKDARRSYKAHNVPGITVSGTFPDKRKAEQIGEHSGFIALDVDDVEDLDTARAELYADDYVFAGFVSISGGGLCLIVKIDGARHADAYRGLERYFLAQYGYAIDPSCKDVSRLRFVSYDPDLYLNTDAKRWNKYPKKERAPKKIPVFPAGPDDLEHVLKQVEAGRIDLTSDYDTWCAFAFALNHEYGDAGEAYFHRFSQYHPEYDPQRTSRKYRAARGDGRVTMATIYYHAKRAGIDVTTPKTRTIVTAASWGKRGKRTKEQVVQQLAEVDEIPRSESEPIVDAVFDSKARIDDDAQEDTVEQVEQYLARNRKIVYNQITLKYEEGGKPLNDRDLNSTYLDIKKVIPKASRELVFMCIESDRTPIVNPVHEWFKRNSSRQSRSSIRALAESIDSPTGYRDENFCPDFVYTFMRKWLIGSVAMWHGEHSPLMLVLAGQKQSTGKTHFFRYLLPDELQPYYGEAELTGDKDENLLMCTKIIIMNDEMSNKSKRDFTVMKQLSSKQWFNVRRPYGRLSEDFRRIASLAGTSNNVEILSDPTGNRRIIPIEVNAIDHDKYNGVDKADVWAEAYHAFQAGESYALTRDDIDLLNANTAEFEESSSEAELIQRFFSVPARGAHASKMTATDIKAYCESRTQQRLNLRRIGMELKRMGFEQRIERTEQGHQRLYTVHERSPFPHNPPLRD